MPLNRLKTPALLLLAVLMETALIAILRIQDPARHLLPFVAWALVAALLYLIAVWVVLALPGKCGRPGWILILGAALIFRLTLLPLAPTLSHTFARQHWEGKVQSFNSPFNPYFFAPDNPILVPLRGSTFSHLQRPQLAATSPPLAELVTRWNFRISILPAGEKLLGIVFDLLLIWPLAGLLRRYGLNSDRVLIYAWAPLAVIEMAGNGSLVALALFLLLMAFYLAGEWDRFSHLALGLAIMLNLAALLLAPAWYRRIRRRHWLWLLAPVLLCSWPYLFFERHFFLPAWGHNLAAGFKLWLAASANGGLALLPRLFGASLQPPARLAALAAFFAVFVWLSTRNLQPPRMAKLCLAALLLLVPRLQPGVALWLLPWLAFDPDPAWLYFISGVLLAYPALVSSAYRQTAWMAWEFLPLYGLLIWGWLQRRRRNAKLSQGRSVPA